MIQRTNEEWLSALRGSGEAHQAALADLRLILLSGLQRGLLPQINTSAPEFASQAEDFVQEALLRILDKLDTFAGRSMFTTWAHKIAISIALTELRRKRWQDASLSQITAGENGQFAPGVLADQLPSPEMATERAEMIARVQRLISDGLTPRQQTAVIASIIQGLPTPEVARQMDMTPNAFYKLLHDARVRLKKGLEAEGLTPAEILSVFS